MMLPRGARQHGKCIRCEQTFNTPGGTALTDYYPDSYLGRVVLASRCQSYRGFDQPLWPSYRSACQPNQRFHRGAFYADMNYSRWRLTKWENL